MPQGHEEEEEGMWARGSHENPITEANLVSGSRLACGGEKFKHKVLDSAVLLPNPSLADLHGLDNVTKPIHKS